MTDQDEQIQGIVDDLDTIQMIFRCKLLTDQQIRSQITRSKVRLTGQKLDQQIKIQINGSKFRLSD